jgi:hypothetical protein
MNKSLHEAAGHVIQEAWETKDLTLLAEGLSDDINFYENVLEKPLTDKQSILSQWKRDLTQQSDIKVQLLLLDWVENRGYHRCKASWKDNDGTVSEIDAIYIISIDSNGKIISFLPWYTSKD